MNLKRCERLKVSGHQVTLPIKETVKTGLNLHFTGIDAKDVDAVINVMNKSFGLVSVCIQKSKNDRGVDID